MNRRFAVAVVLIAVTALCLAAINMHNWFNLLEKKD